jgi:hypothetical protein
LNAPASTEIYAPVDSVPLQEARLF